jgi:hypothetical protein
MGTKELGWSAARFSAARFLALVLSVSTVGITLSVNPAQAQSKKARDKIVELNKQALLSYEAKDYETAKDLLNKALKEAKQSGLDDDKMTARTYLHLGAVYWVGFQDQSVAIQNFTLAKKIRPDIQLTPSIETGDLKSVFDLAVVEPEPSIEPDATRPPTPAKPLPRPTPSRPSSSGGGEPDLPDSAEMTSPLMCSVPSGSVPSGKELSLRCALKHGLNAKTVQLHFRAPGVEAYKNVDMRKTAKGWYVATIPSFAMKGGSLQLYFDARDASNATLASNGQVDSPTAVIIGKKSSSSRQVSSSGGSDKCKDSDDPMCQINEDEENAAYEAGLHRRRDGAFWLAVGGGGGWGYSPAGTLEWRQKVNVSAITAPTGMYVLFGEIGYLLSDSLGLAIQTRYESIKQEQLPKDPGPTYSGAPTNQALAFFLKGIHYTDLGGGNLQLSISADVGGGFVRIPVRPTRARNMVPNPDDPEGAEIPDPKNTIYKTDTRPIGPILFGSSAGLIYHFARYFGVSLDARVLSGLSSFGVVIEGGLSLHISSGGKKGPAKMGEEGEGGEGEGEQGGGGGENATPSAPAAPVKDEPPSPVDDLSSDDEE